MQLQGEKKINVVVLTFISILAYDKLSLSTLWRYESMGLWMCIYTEKKKKEKKYINKLVNIPLEFTV